MHQGASIDGALQRMSGGALSGPVIDDKRPLKLLATGNDTN